MKKISQAVILLIAGAFLLAGFVPATMPTAVAFSQANFAVRYRTDSD